MDSEQPGKDEPPATGTADSPSLPDIKQLTDASAATKAQMDALHAQIQLDYQAAAAKLDEIENSRRLAEASRARIESVLQALAGDVASATLQLDSARAAAAELSALADAARATNAASSETSKQATISVETAKQLASRASEIIGKIEGIRDEAVQTQATIAERNSFIQGGLDHVARVQRELDAVLDAAKRSALSVETIQAETKATSDATVALHSAIQAIKDKVDNDSLAVAAIRTAIDGHANTTKNSRRLRQLRSQKLLTMNPS